MRESFDAGRPQTATDWSRHDAPSMWRMLEPQETETHWRNAAGLRKITELTATHMARLQVYRDQLAEAWPPAKSPAARAFIGRLDYLINHVRATHEVAATNYTALTTATTTIESARNQVANIHAEYTEKLQSRKTYDSLVESTRASQLPGTSLGRSPVTDADFERLNARARAVMQDLSHALISAQNQFRRPTPFETERRFERGSSIPPPPARPRVVGLTPPSRAVARPQIAMPPSTQSGSAGTTAPSQAETQRRTPHVNRVPPGLGGQASTSALHPQNRQSRDAIRPQPATPSIGQGQGVVRQVLQPGGVIRPPGGTSASTEGWRGGLPTGLIAPRSEGQSTMAPFGLTPARAPDDRKSTAERPPPDSHWDSPEGVPPVLLPPVVPTQFDPGPAIGLDR